ncbi:hypothetical protein [Endozoicomonas ascidiicola]|uniref:hypothetical protein n=1 Tax=Endozoicomonas ascidiicola TaxID=1698521 RepID=UPI00082EFF8C|nr:hypothetical protein [Endozoicomonas ascidiicola]
MGGIVKSVKKAFKKIGKAVKKTVVGSVFGIGKKDEVKIPEPTPTAPEAPTPEEQVQGGVQNEDISRKKKRGRGGLRIDLNTGGSGSTGLNVPNG